MNEYFKEVRRLADMEQGVLAQKEANDARTKELDTVAKKLSKALEDFKYAKLKDNQELMKKYGMLQDVMSNEKKQLTGLLTQIKLATTTLQHEIGNARQERVKTETAQKLAERAREKVKNEEEKEKRRNEAENRREQKEREKEEERKRIAHHRGLEADENNRRRWAAEKEKREREKQKNLEKYRRDNAESAKRERDNQKMYRKQYGY